MVLMPEGTFRILVTGSRDWRDEKAIRDAILEVAAGNWYPHQVTIVHGACPTGADRLAGIVADILGCTVERHPPDWTGPCRPECLPGHRRLASVGVTYCPMAGLYRNQEMVDLGADVVLAFQRKLSRGTQHCIDRARAAGLPVIVREETT